MNVEPRESGVWRDAGKLHALTARRAIRRLRDGLRIE